MGNQEVSRSLASPRSKLDDKHHINGTAGGIPYEGTRSGVGSIRGRCPDSADIKVAHHLFSGREQLPQNCSSPPRKRHCSGGMMSRNAGASHVPVHAAGRCSSGSMSAPTSRAASVPRLTPSAHDEVVGLEARVRAAFRGGKPCTPAAKPAESTTLAPIAKDISSLRLASAFKSQAICTERKTLALIRFSTGGVTGLEDPEIRAGWFKSPVEKVSMEQLNNAHDQDNFLVLPLKHAAVWKECHIEFYKSIFGFQVQLNILSGGAMLEGGPDNCGRPSANRVGLYFPGFQALALKLLFRHRATQCNTAIAQDPVQGWLQHALINPVPSALPLGFSVHLRPKPFAELTKSERLAKEYFVQRLSPAIGRLHDDAAAYVEGLVQGLRPGEERQAEAGIAAIFDRRPGSQVICAKMMGAAKSASAPRFVKLWQAPPGQSVQVKHILLKSGDNPHHDRFALAMARVFNHLWRQEGVGVTVGGQSELVQNVLYGVLQSSVRTSVIEVVSGSTPVKSYHDRHSRVMLAIFGDSWWQGDLNDWVPSAPLLASAAAAFITAYILGIGDRHQDNMLVTRQGHLFNIDFSYLFGERPRVVDAQPFAIPVAFRTALIQNGPLWAMFKGACVRAFATLVKHREFVVLQAIETARSLGSHFLVTNALTFGSMLAEPGIEVARRALARRSQVMPCQLFNTLDLLPDESLDSFVEVVGSDLSKRIDRGVYGHQAKDLIHERQCAVM